MTICEENENLIEKSQVQVRKKTSVLIISKTTNAANI